MGDTASSAASVAGQDAVLQLTAPAAADVITKLQQQTAYLADAAVQCIDWWLPSCSSMCAPHLSYALLWMRLLPLKSIATKQCIAACISQVVT